MRRPSWEIVQPEAAKIPAKYRARNWSAFRMYWRANERFFDEYVAENIKLVTASGDKLDPDPQQRLQLAGRLMHEFVWGSFDALGGKVYKIASEFGAELHRTALDLPVRHAPRSPEVVCIEFPEGIAFDVPTDEGPRQVTSVYLFSLDGEDVEPGAEVTYHLFVPMSLVGSSEFSHWQHYWESLGSAATTIDESFAKGEDSSTVPATKGFAEAMHRVVVYALKSLLYIHSGEPDLREYRAPRPSTQNPKKLRRWEKEHADRPKINMTLVGYDWKKPRVYGVDSTLVSGHFRWQPYGPGRTQVKLIWISQHERHFKNAAPHAESA